MAGSGSVSANTAYGTPKRKLTNAAPLNARAWAGCDMGDDSARARAQRHRIWTGHRLGGDQPGGPVTPAVKATPERSGLQSAALGQSYCSRNTRGIVRPRPRATAAAQYRVARACPASPCRAGYRVDRGWQSVSTAPFMRVSGFTAAIRFDLVFSARPGRMADPLELLARVRALIPCAQ